MILMDTDICIEILRGNRRVMEKRQETDDRVAISFMTVAELYYGAEKSKNRKKNKYLVEEFFLSIDIINTDMDILRWFGDIKARLEFGGNALADADILIAATCLSKCNRLITGNIKHFNRIDNLFIENWIR